MIKIFDLNNILLVFGSRYLTYKDYGRRLEAIGWKLHINHNGHYEYLAPPYDKSKMICFSPNNWDRHWQLQKTDLRKISPDLDFVWKTPFIIPENYNPLTLKIEENANTELKVKFLELARFDLNDIEILYNGQWLKPLDIDYSTFEIMFNNSEVIAYNHNSILTIRQIRGVRRKTASIC